MALTGVDPKILRFVVRSEISHWNQFWRACLASLVALNLCPLRASGTVGGCVHKKSVCVCIGSFGGMHIQWWQKVGETRGTVVRDSQGMQHNFKLAND
jgi:hypothetical protein